MQIACMERGIMNFLIIATLVMAIRRMKRLMDIANEMQHELKGRDALFEVAPSERRVWAFL